MSVRARLRGFCRSEGGQGLIEFALIVPVLLVLLIGTIEIGQAWRSSQAVTHAAREGARVSVVPTSTDATVNGRIADALRGAELDPARAAVELRRRTGTGTLDTVTVRYPYEFRMLEPVLRLTGGGANAIWLRSTFVMRNE